jgi:uncharacterized protein (TIGR02118 family)
MIIRSAFLEGSVAPEDQEDFDGHMRNTVLSAIGTYPCVRGISLRRLEQRDDGAPEIYMIFDILFDSIEDMDAALASDTRERVREQIAKVMPAFKGRVYHIVFEDDVNQQ